MGNGAVSSSVSKVGGNELLVHEDASLEGDGVRTKTSKNWVDLLVG